MDIPTVVAEVVRGVVGAGPTIWQIPAGAEEASVYSAGTAHSPEERPFFVIRWGVEVRGIGRVNLRPFEVWIYDEEGDYTRPNAIGLALNEAFSQIEAVLTETGSLLQVEIVGRSGDFSDEGYKAVVVPMRYTAVGSGL